MRQGSQLAAIATKSIITHEDRVQTLDGGWLVLSCKLILPSVIRTSTPDHRACLRRALLMRRDMEPANASKELTALYGGQDAWIADVKVTRMPGLSEETDVTN